MELCLISYEQFFEEETDLVTELLSNYDFTFHLRKPNAMMEDIRQFLSRVPSALHCKIMLHNGYPLAQEFNVKGLHFSTQNRHWRSAFRGLVNSTSSHSLEEVAKLDREFDYQFLSPVFASISKPGYTGNLDLEAVKDFLQSSRSGRIIALGGITEKNTSRLKTTGFDGVAVLGSVWGRHPEKIPKSANVSTRFSTASNHLTNEKNTGNTIHHP